MQEKNNLTQSAGDNSAQKAGNNEKSAGRKPRARRNISAEAAHVLKFLNSCTQYQADAVRVTVSHATGNRGCETIAPAERLAVNRFLNNGMNRGNTPSIEAALQFRVERSEVLMRSVRPFCGPEEILKASFALMRITTDAEAVKKAFDNLPESR